MILWGWGERVLTFDLAEHEHCQRCEQHQDFVLRLKYKYGHFYHLFGWVISKQYQLICPVCSHGWIVNASAAEAQIGRNPVPFHQRSGWIVMLALAAIIGFATVTYQHAA
ncbi:hypothetical protein [Xanthomonas arboricola]|uniref:hypothetical protein n=1 Tax=Xanthomonas arboricola TaxID=56448 RepID=UPI0012D2EC0A|nr:hypothetical protein [Xanthomonas arboricola]